MNLLPFLAGAFAGLAGAVPFLHTNLILQFAGPLFSDPLGLALFACSLAGSHVVFEAVPAVFFSLPSQDGGVGALPAHKLASQGRAAEALSIIACSTFLSAVFCVFLLPVAAFALPIAYSAVRPFVPLLLAALVALYFISDSLRNAAFGFAVFAISGAVGFACLNAPLGGGMLFPLLTGLFGIPAILSSLSAGPAVPQKQTSAGLSFNPLLAAAGTALGSVAGLVPAISPSFLSASAFLFLEDRAEAFLALNSSVVFSKLFYDVVVVFFTGRARSGHAVPVEAVAGSLPGFGTLSFYAAACAASAFAALAVLLFFSKRLAGFRLDRIHYAFALVGVTAGVFLLSGFPGLLVLAAASAVGSMPAALGVRQGYAMGALIAPSLAYYAGLSGLMASIAFG